MSEYDYEIYKNTTMMLQTTLMDSVGDVVEQGGNPYEFTVDILAGLLSSTMYQIIYDLKGSEHSSDEINNIVANTTGMIIKQYYKLLGDMVDGSDNVEFVMNEGSPTLN